MSLHNVWFFLRTLRTPQKYRGAYTASFGMNLAVAHQILQGIRISRLCCAATAFLCLLQATAKVQQGRVRQCMIFKMLTEFTLKYGNCIGVLLKADTTATASKDASRTPSKLERPAGGAIFRSHPHIHQAWWLMCTCVGPTASHATILQSGHLAASCMHIVMTICGKQ